MGHYEIREDGTLWAEKYDLKYVDDPEYSKKYSALFDVTMDHQRAVKTNETWVPYFVHDKIVTIYEFYSPMNESYEYTTKFDYWMEYEITFSNSVVSEVRLLKRRSREEKDARLKVLFNSMEQTPLEKIVTGFFVFWRRLTRWIPSSRTVETYILNKL
jgi:hypothetical protein